ncbi:hypothetical protein NKI46_25550 [Mesorhizobium sp. M0615]|uniref:hypothetical protein n=1 Tax=Mesorhizobium sp. M0615 TaxID=2956971 RepID=UPI00333DA4AC
MDDTPRRPSLPAETIQALVLETGVTEAEIRTIISLVGLDRASILREARYLKKLKNPQAKS